MTLDRLIANFMLWGIGGCAAWLVSHEYTAFVDDRFDAISRALGGL